MKPRTTSIGTVRASVFTSPHDSPDSDPEIALLEALVAARDSITFALYALTSPALANGLLAAHRRGVHVYGVADATQAIYPTSKMADLMAAGVPVRRWGTRWRLMHDKVAIIDPLRPRRCTVALGSYNWTTAAQKANVEVLLLAHGSQAARALAPVLLKQVNTVYDNALPLNADPLSLADRIDALSTEPQRGSRIIALPDPII